MTDRIAIKTLQRNIRKNHSTNEKTESIEILALRIVQRIMLKRSQDNTPQNHREHKIL